MYAEFTNKILDKWGIYWEDLAYSNNIDICYGDLVCTLLEHRSMKASSEYLGISNRTLERIVPATLGKYCNKDSSNTTPWSISLLAQIDIRKCPKCKQYLIWSQNFTSRTDCICKACDGSDRKEARLTSPQKFRDRGRKHYLTHKYDYILKSSNRKKELARATPSWANIDKMREIYNNCPKGYHVDHVIPLKGSFVCGLHVEGNLQYLTAADNLSKSNRFTV